MNSVTWSHNVRDFLRAAVFMSFWITRCFQYTPFPILSCYTPFPLHAHSTTILLHADSITCRFHYPRFQCSRSTYDHNFFTTWHDGSPMILVFWRQISSPHINGMTFRFKVRL